MDKIPTDELIRDLAKFEDRIAVLERMTPEERAAIVAEAPMNDIDAELTGCEGATLPIEDALRVRGIGPRQAVAEYRDGYEAWTGPGDEQDNPYSGFFTSTGDADACEAAAEWDPGHEASQADYHKQGQA